MTVTNIQEDFLLICLLCNKSCRENIIWGSFRMAKDKKQSRPKAETPKGFRDYFDQEVSERNEMLQKVARVYHHHGFDALETSAVENVDALGKFLPDVDRPNDGVFAWQEDDNSWLALRYDLTAPLARVYAQYRNELPNPFRRYAMGPVWRNEKPGPGRFRQFYQCDADTIGAPNVVADAEVCAMLADALEEVGIPPGDYTVNINNRKILNGVLEMIGLDDQTKRLEVLRVIDKYDKVGVSGVAELLGVGRLDASGAYIDGVGLSKDQAAPVLAFLTAKGDTNEKTLLNLREVVGNSVTGAEGISELDMMAELLTVGDYSPNRVQLDPSVVRGLEYYTGPVFEAELTFEIYDTKGRKRQFGSVAGGGRYDDLVKRFTGQTIPATGVSIGVDRLMAALREKDRSRTETIGPVVVTVMDRERLNDYLSIVSELRSSGIRAEMYLGNPKNFGNQLRYADKRRSPLAIIEGSEERDKGLIQIKDLILGTQLAKNATLEEWKERPSQFTVPKKEMVSKVQEMLRALKK